MTKANNIAPLRVSLQRAAFCLRVKIFTPVNTVGTEPPFQEEGTRRGGGDFPGPMLNRWESKATGSSTLSAFSGRTLAGFLCLVQKCLGRKMPLRETFGQSLRPRNLLELTAQRMAVPGWHSGRRASAGLRSSSPALGLVDHQSHLTSDAGPTEFVSASHNSLIMTRGGCHLQVLNNLLEVTSAFSQHLAPTYVGACLPSLVSHSWLRDTLQGPASAAVKGAPLLL